MPVLSADSLSSRDRYTLLTDIVAPRPIAWVSTVSSSGERNLAPFSYFQAVCSNPATVILGFGWRSDGPKDSLRNILATREMTISHVDERHAEAMNQTAGVYPSDVDEWSVAGLEAVPSAVVGPPRVAHARAALECVLRRAIPIGAHSRGNGPSSTLVIAEVVSFYLREGLVHRNDEGHLAAMDPAALEAVGRLGGVGYTTCRGQFTLKRPTID